MKQSIPCLELSFRTPTAGYWNGGLKSGGIFKPEPCSVLLCTSRKGKYYKVKTYKDKDGEVKWGCWELNFFFYAKFGRSWKHAATIAKNKLRRLCIQPCTIAVEGL